MTVADALKILELHSPYTTEELGKAYRHALMVWHPDRFSGNEELIKKAEARTREIIEAFELLSSLAASEGAAGTVEQAEKAAPVREAGTQDSQRAAGTVPLPQMERLTTTGKKGRGSSDRATWIITGVSVVVAGVLIAVLSHHSPKIKGEPPNVESLTKIESVASATPLPVADPLTPKPPTADPKPLANGDSLQLIEMREKAERGDVLAQSKLGVMYWVGDGVSKNDVEAAKWYRMAAEQGDATSQHNLACCYFDGSGVAKDLKEAAKWFRNAAEGGFGEAQFRLAYALSSGEGVEKDDVEAVSWYRKAVESTIIRAETKALAQYNLGVCYVRGIGVPKDEVEAAKWFQMAALANLPSAQFNLGLLYADGKIGLQPRSKRTGDKFYLDLNPLGINHVEAHVWFNLAGANGHEEARKKIVETESKMSREERSEATAKAKELFEKLKGAEKK